MKSIHYCQHEVAFRLKLLLVDNTLISETIGYGLIMKTISCSSWDMLAVYPSLLFKMRKRLNILNYAHVIRQLQKSD